MCTQRKPNFFRMTCSALKSLGPSRIKAEAEDAHYFLLSLVLMLFFAVHFSKGQKGCSHGQRCHPFTVGGVPPFMVGGGVFSSSQFWKPMNGRFHLKHFNQNRIPFTFLTHLLVENRRVVAFSKAYSSIYVSFSDRLSLTLERSTSSRF